MSTPTNFDKLFDPSSIAVIGATETPGSPGRTVLEMLLRSGKTLLPVHPSRRSVLGIPAFSSAEQLPTPVDLAVVTVSAEAAVDAAERCAARGIPFIVVLAGGFSETGPVGRALEDRLKAIPARFGSRVLGPNSLGLFVPGNKLDTIFVEHGDRSLAAGGGVAFISQSGSVAVEALGLASNIGFGLHSFVGLGNKSDLDELDFLSCFGGTDEVTCVACYLESLESGRAFLEQARAVSSRKPVIVLKAGRTAAGAAAVSSHTGRLAGSDRVIGGAFRQFGILRALDDEELCDAARTLSALPPARGKRVAIVTPAGGYGVMCADAVESRPRGVALELAELGAETRSRIQSATFPFASCRNPVDLTASADDRMFGESLDALLSDAGVDIVICIAFFAPPSISEGLINVIAARAAHAEKPILVFTQYGPFTDGHLRRFYDAGVIGFPSISRTVRAASFLVERSAILGALGEPK